MKECMFIADTTYMKTETTFMAFRWQITVIFRHKYDLNHHPIIFARTFKHHCTLYESQ